MRKMKDSGVEWIGEIPEKWSIGRVKHAFNRKNEKAMQDDPVILSLARSGVRVRDVSNNEGQVAESYFNYNPVDIDDLLLNPMDLYSGANCSISKVVGVISPAYVNLRSKDGINPVFYDYYFKVQYWLMAFFAHGKGVSYENRWTLNTETLMNYPVVTLSYEEQCKRADYLDDKCVKIDSIIAREQAVIEKLKAYKLSVITEVVTKGLKPGVPMKDSGVEWIGKIPEHWEVAKIKYGVTKVGSGKTPRGGSEIYSDKGILFIRSQNVYDDGLEIDDATFISEDIDDEMKNTRVFGNDILLNITGGSIGRACIYPTEVPHANVNQHVCIIRVNREVYIPSYMHYLWISWVGRVSIDIYQSGANREGMNFEQIKNSYMPRLNVCEQIKISNYLDSKCIKIKSVINKKQAVIDNLTEYKKSLIFEVVTGKKEV